MNIDAHPTARIPVEPPEGTDPRPDVPLPAPAALGSRFDPTDPADLEQLAAHLLQRSGRLYSVPAPFEFPVDAGDPNTEWTTYPEDPAIQHVHPATRTAIRVSFPPGDSFRIFGFTAVAGDPAKLRTIDRTGRFFDAGPATLAWILARFIDTEIVGDPPRSCPGPK